MVASNLTRFTKRYDAVSQEKSGGATYTPKALADFVARAMVSDAALPGDGTAIRILDPAVGDGELILSLLDALNERQVRVAEVHGFDTDEVALRAAQQRIKAAHPLVSLSLSRSSFLELALAANDRPDLFDDHAHNPFDLIIANPPYVRTQIIGAEKAKQLAVTFGLAGRVDLYHAFLIGISRVLKPSGTAGLIVSNRFMSTRGGARLRHELRTKLSLRHVWDLGDTKIFDAAVLPAVILAHGLDTVQVEKVRFTSIYETVSGHAPHRAPSPFEALAVEGAVEIEDGRSFIVKQGVLDQTGPSDDVWRIATVEGDAWLAAVAANTWGTFKDIGKIRVGVKTTADKIFLRKDWHTFSSERRPELLRPLTTHHVAARFRAEPAGVPREILYPHEVLEGRRRPSDLDRYPKTRAYLEEHRGTLEARTYVVESGREWFEIWVPQDPSAWAKPKLVFRDISERPTFWIDLDHTIVNGDCYWLVCEDDAQTDLLWLAASVANSSFIESFYDRRFNNKLYAGRRRFITQYVELFPLPDPSLPTSLALIAGAKTMYASVDLTERSLLEKRLDGLVWDAFGLGIEKPAG